MWIKLILSLLCFKANASDYRSFELKTAYENLPDGAHKKTLGANIKRWERLPASLGHSYVLVNIASARLEYWHEDKLILSMPVIVGAEKTPTPIFQTNLVSVDINPEWTIPNSIMTEEIAPKLRLNPLYLEQHDIHIFEQQNEDWDEVLQFNEAMLGNSRFKFVQTSGSRFNPLGKLRFNTDPKLPFGLHDTNQPYLFNQSGRYASHGCIRLKSPQRFTQALVKTQALKLLAELSYLLALKQPLSLQLNRPIPIYVVYFTAWVDRRKIIHFEPDIYGLDE